MLIARVGIAAAFAANAVGYIAFQISLANLRDLPPLPMRAAQNAVRASLEAFSYVSRHKGMAPMMLLFAVTTIGTRGFIELFPGFADSVFHRGPQGLAMLTSTVGLGAIFGGTWMLIRSQISGLTTVVLANTLLMSLAIVAFTATDQFLLALPCVFVAGAAMVITGIGAQTLIQASVDHSDVGPGDGALRHDLPRRACAGRGDDGHRQRPFRPTPAAGNRRAAVDRLLGADPGATQGDRRCAGSPSAGR